MNESIQASETIEVTPLIRRIQKALLDGHTVSIEEMKYTWAPRSGLLPELDANDRNEYQATEAGVFREAEWQKGEVHSKKWIRLCHLDGLDDMLGPRLVKMTPFEREAVSVGLTFQIVMTAENQSKERRRSRPGH